VADAYNSSEHLEQDRHIVAANGGALAFDTALAIGAGGLGMRKGLNLKANWQADAAKGIKSTYGSAVKFLAEVLGEGRLGMAFAGRDALPETAKPAPIDIARIVPGKELVFNDYLHLIRLNDGTLFARARTASDGIYTQIKPGKNVLVAEDSHVYFGDRRNDAMILQAGQSLRPGREEPLTPNRVVGKDTDGNIYVRQEGSGGTGTFVKTVAAGDHIAVKASDKAIHLGPYGIVEINQPVATISPVAQPARVALPAINAGAIAPGKGMRVNDYMAMERRPDGRLYAKGSPLSDGIFTKVEAGKNVFVAPGDAVYFGYQRYDADIIKTAQNIRPGSEEQYSVHRVIGRDQQGNVYLRDDGHSSYGTFVKAVPPGKEFEIKPGDSSIHLGPYGLVEVRQPVVPVTPAARFNLKQHRGPALPAPPPMIAPVVPPRPLAPPLVQRPGLAAGPAPRLNWAPLLKDLDDLRLGNDSRTDDPDWRHGQYADVVLNPAVGGIERPDNWVQSLYGNHEDARASARFVAGIFRRRLRTDAHDKATEPGTRTYTQPLRTPDGKTYFLPGIHIEGMDPGTVVLDRRLQPAGLLDHLGVQKI
jgi:hypothetical protein